MKKILKIFLIIIVFIFVGYFIFLNYEKWSASKKIDDIKKYAKNINDIELDKNISIIALGEATHGNKEFQSLKLEVFKQLVEKYNYRSILFELDYGEGLFINDYVQGKSNLTIDEIMDNISFDIYKTKEIKELILWIKNYNIQKSVNEKISFYGYDMQNPEKSIKYIINNINGIDNNKLEILTGTIKLSDEKVQEAIEYLKTIHSENELINYAITNTLNSYNYFQTTNLNDYVEANNNRDKLMSNNVIWIHEIEKSKGNDKIMISAHNGHIAKKDFNYTNMGNILKNHFEAKYYALGTDYFNTICNIKYGLTRIDFKANSANILAYQAKYYGNYFLDFAKVNEKSQTYSIITSQINHGSLGEGYSPLMKFLPQTTRIKIIPTKYYDGMIFVYDATPSDFNID